MAKQPGTSGNSPDDAASAAQRGRAARRESDQGSPARFRRVRKDHSSEIAEDYLELIAELIRDNGEARIVDIARALGVSHVTVTKTIARLRRDGLVRAEPYRAIFLTAEGEEIARECAARHELVVRFLHALGVNEEDAEADAEGIEHHISDATLAAMERFIERKR